MGSVISTQNVSACRKGLTLDIRHQHGQRHKINAVYYIEKYNLQSVMLTRNND